MNKIIPNIDWYGRYGRASALADYLEVAAISDIQLTRAAVANMIETNDWSRRVAREQFSSVDENDAEQDEARDVAERVFNIIAERRESLDARYPFGVDSNGKIRFVGSRYQPYVALLSITVAHASGLDVPLDVTQVFEDTVHDVFQSRGWRAVNLGRLARGVGFKNGVMEAGNELKLQTDPDAAPHSLSAQDEKVDTIADYPWCSRPGRWLVIGQVTCAQTDAWRDKLLGPSSIHWQQWLGEVVAPNVFLAVPHHAERRFRTALISGSNRYVLDRISLTLQKASLSSDEEAIVSSVLGSTVERL